MALKLNKKEFSTGVVVENVYCKVDEIGGSQDVINARVRYYANQEARLANKEWVGEKIHTFTPNNSDDAPNIFKQCYEDLKANDSEFTDSVDC